jgi:signal peptidase I
VSDLACIPNLSEGSAPLQSPDLKRRLIAAALSTLLPGAGQLYLRRYNKAAFLFIALLAISLGFWPLRLPRSYLGVLLLLWMLVPLSWFAILNALLARDSPLSAKISRWWIPAGIPLSYIGVNLVFTPLLLGSGFHPMKNISTSMEPTIFAGDKLVVDERYFHHQPVRRGELVLLRRALSGSETSSGRDETLLLIKRVAGIAGDTLEGKDHQVLLNGQQQHEPYVQHKFAHGANSNLGTFGPVTIPAGKYFVMGDNRDVSLDSRTASFGLVDASAIVGKPLYGYRITGNPLSWPLN